MFAVILSWKSLVPVENLTGKANTTYYVKFCGHSGDGPDGGWPHVAGAAFEIEFTSAFLAGLPTNLNSLTLGPWSYNRPTRPPRSSRHLDPVLGGPSGGSGWLTYGPFTGNYFIYKDFATPVDVLSAPPGEPGSHLVTIVWDLMEFFVTAQSVHGVDFGTGSRISCIKSAPYDNSPTVSSGPWTINFPAKNFGYPNSVSGNARQIP